MAQTAFYFLITIVFNCCNSKVTKDSLCGNWFNEEENLAVILRCDGTFTVTNIPTDIDNCFFNYHKKIISGIWNKSDEEHIKLSFERGSYCFIEIVNGNSVHLRMRTKSDSNIIIDLKLQQ